LKATAIAHCHSDKENKHILNSKQDFLLAYYVTTSLNLNWV